MSQAKEVYTSLPEKLGPHLKWFVPGLIYPLANLPDSIFNLCSAKGGVDPAVTSLLLPTPLYTVRNMNMPNDNWANTIQGIPLARTMDFLTHLESIRFRNSIGTWRVKAERIKLSDPLSTFNLVDVFYLLPHCPGVMRVRIRGLSEGITAVAEVVRG